MKILVVGVGSIGVRHARNLRKLGVAEVLAIDPDPERLALAREQGATACPTLEAGLDATPAGVIVCAPPDQHLAVAEQAVARGIDVFVEKPIAPAANGVAELLDEAARRGRTVSVGYNLRFHPGLRVLRSLLEHGSIGRLLLLRAEFGQYLPDWRPGHDYRRGYIAQREGGGIILDGSHELDYVRWLAGEVAAVAAVAGRLSDLEMAAEDSALILLRLRSGAIAHVHLDCVQRGYSRACKLIGTEGTLAWDFEAGVRLFTAERAKWEEHPVAADVNDMYVDEMRHWLACLRGEAAPVSTGADALETLRVALAVRMAAATGREVSL